MPRAVVVVARFQPPHRGHFAAIEYAARSSERVIVLMLGADEACSLRNPWSLATRRALLERGLAPLPAIEFLAVRDLRYERALWTRRVEETVRRHLGPRAEVAVIGEQDRRSDVPPLPAAWQSIGNPVRFSDGENLLRALLLWREGRIDWSTIDPHLAPATRDPMRESVDQPAFQELVAEASFIRAFKEGWATAPYPPVFVTVDALVTWRDQVLLIERGQLPGKGLLALPGGFVDQRETLAAASVRELREETGLDLAAVPVPPGRVFDDPYRSLRGRTLTHVFHFALDIASAPPPVRGGDDARRAAWMPTAGLSPVQLFEDHYAILQTMLGVP